MSEIKDLNYKKNRDVIVNKAKDSFKNNKERLKEQTTDKYRSLSKEEKNEAIKERSRNRYKNFSQEEKYKIKDYQRKRYQELVPYKKEALKNK